MNCLRSLEFIRRIDGRYKKFGLATIIIHPPEWDFEKKMGNIADAVKRYNIDFPIIMDKNKKILKKLRINFWPAQILIKNRKIVYKHIGEGNYKKLEYAIMGSLNIKSKRMFYEEPIYGKFQTVYCGKRKKGAAKFHNRLRKLKFGVNYVDNNWMQKREYIKSIRSRASLTLSTKGKILTESSPPIEAKMALTSGSAKASLISFARTCGFSLKKVASILAVGNSLIFKPHSVKILRPFS